MPISRPARTCEASFIVDPLAWQAGAADAWGQRGCPRETVLSLQGRSCLCQPAGLFHDNSCLTPGSPHTTLPHLPLLFPFPHSLQQGANFHSANLDQLPTEGQMLDLAFETSPQTGISISGVWDAGSLLGLNTCERKGRKQDWPCRKVN